MKLRHYQQDALNAVYEYLAFEPGNPLVVIPTGGGKTPIIATICRDAAECGKRVLVLTHVKELLTQSAEKLRLVAPDLSFGVYCAGLGQKECADQIVLASIQSAYRRAKQLGAFDLVIIDEAHRVPEDEKSMYRLLLRDLQSVNPQVRLIGFTATPYRLDAGDIYGQENSLFHHVVYEVSILQLIEQGYLCKLSSSPPWPDDEEEEALEGQLAEVEGESEYEKSRNDPKKHNILPEERLPILSALVPEQKTEYVEALVRRVEYHVHTKRGAGTDYPKSMRVDYYLDDLSLFSVSEWVCLDHVGFPRKKAERWLDQRLRPGWLMPETVAEAVHVGREGGYFEPKTILVSRKPNEVFWTVVQWYCSERDKAYDAR